MTKSHEKPDPKKPEPKKLAPPPGPYRDFVSRYPDLGRAWDAIRDAEKSGPLDRKTRRLLKLAVAMGAMSSGGVSSAVRKALAAGATREEVEQVVALAASIVGLPGTVALHGWVKDAVDDASA